MKNFIGINTRSSDDLAYIRKFDFVREYHEWSDDTGFDQDGIPNCPQNLLSFSPSNSEAAVIDLDDFYRQLSGRVSPVMKWLAPEMRGLKWYDPTLQEQKPLCGNIGSLNQDLPESYIDYTSWVSVFTARYGGNDVCATPGNPYCNLINGRVIDKDILGASRSGLANLQYIELGNEPDKWWYDSEFRNKPNALWQMMPGQYAALLDAAYDGAGKSPAFNISDSDPSFLGIKNIDPDVQVAMGGISDFRGRYLIEMMEKAYDLRASNPNAVKKIPFDILNLHHYVSNNPNIGAAYINNNALWNTYDYYGLNANGISPEQGQLKQRYERFFERLFSGISSSDIKNELAEKDFWLTEFGYDTNNGSAVKAKLAQNNQSYFTTQAQWLVRSYLELSAVEYQYNGTKITLDKVAAFDLRDSGDYGEGDQYSPGGWLYSHCGLLTRDFKPKRSWYYVQTLKNVLGETRFTKDLNPDGLIQFDNGGVPPRIFYYKGDAGQRILTIWSPTSAKVEGRQLTLPVAGMLAAINEPDLTGIDSYTLIRMQDNAETGAKKGYDVTNGKISLDAATSTVSETPVFVLLGEKTDDPNVISPMTGTPQVTAFCNGALLQWDTDADPDGSWKIFYAQKNSLPNYADCGEYKNIDLLGSGFVHTYTCDLRADRKRLLIEGLKANTQYVAFMVFTNAEGISAREPDVVCFSTNTNPPCVINPCLQITSGGDCGFMTDDICKLVIENAGAAYNGSCQGTAQTCVSGNPVTMIGCGTYESGGCNKATLFPADQLWSLCNKPEAIIEFDNAVRLDAIRFYHHSGIDPIDIYYASCEHPDEEKLLTTFHPTDCNNWVTIFNNLPAKPVKKLYFRKIFAYGKARTPSVKIGKLHFCGEELPDCGQKPDQKVFLREENDGFQAFPNPTTGRLRIMWDETGYSELSVFDSGGVLLIMQVLPDNGRITEIDLSRLSAGMYFVRLTGEEKKPLQRKVVLKKD